MRTSLSSAFSRHPNHLLDLSPGPHYSAHTSYTLCIPLPHRKHPKDLFKCLYLWLCLSCLTPLSCLMWRLYLPLASCGIFIFLLWQSLSYHMWSCILLHVWELHSDMSHKSQILPYLLNYDRASWCWYYWWFGSNNYSLWGYTVFFPTWPGLILLGNLMSLCSKKVSILLSDFMGTFNSYST